MTQERLPLRDVQEPQVSSQNYPRSNERYTARGGNVATLTLNSKYQLPQTTVQAQPSAPSVQDTQFRSYTENLVKESIDVIVDEHNHQESPRQLHQCHL